MTLVCRLLVLMLVQIALSAHAFAQVAPKPGPLMGSEAVPNVAAAPGETPPAAPPATPVAPAIGGEDGIYRILVVGDALAGGLGAGMSRMVQDDPRYEIVNRFNESSGLARTDFYDWAAAIPKIASSKTYDAVVILVGVNDRQEIRSGNFRYVFQTPNWVENYKANIRSVLGAIKATSAKTFWVGLPPMGDPAFDADMRYINDLQKQEVTAAGEKFLDVRPFFVAADGSFTDRGPDDTGTDRKLRARDGVTFFKQGNNRFGQIVLELIKPGDTLIAPQVPKGNAEIAAVAPPPGAPQQPPPPVVTAPPIFGQAGLDGEALSFDANSINAARQNQVAAANGAGPAIAGPANSIVALPGTQAEKFFKEGLAPPAPPGRFDDFTVQAAP